MLDDLRTDQMSVTILLLPLVLHGALAIWRG